LMAANEISLLDPYERTLGKCCNDPLRPPGLSECGNLAAPTFTGHEKVRYLAVAQ
jgi:hypothetical protein